MPHKKQKYVKGAFTHRRTEADYMGVLLDAVPLEEWRQVVDAAVTAAKAGDPGARAWLAHYLIGKSGVTAPTPLTVVVQQLSGRDPLIEMLAKPHIDRMEDFWDDKYDAKNALKARVAKELDILEAQNATAPEATNNTDGSTDSENSR